MSVVPRACSHLFLIIALSMVPVEVAAARADIEDLEAVADTDTITVAVRLDGAFDQPGTLEAVQSGLPVVIVYQFDLIHKRENWFDSILYSSEIEMVATYNSLTREFLLNYRRDRKLVSSESIRSIDELRRRMSTIREEGLFEIGTYRPRDLRVRARAVLGRRYLLHVIPRLVTTDWGVARVTTRERR